MKPFLLLVVAFLALFSTVHAISLISDGSLEDNCGSPTSCVYSVSVSSGISSNTIGDDWIQFRTPGTEGGFGTREFHIIKDGNLATNGQYYGRLFSLGSTSGLASQDLKNLQLLHSGKVSIDINYIGIGGSFDGLFIFYDFNDSTLGTQTLATINNGNFSQYLGHDINFQLPNETGYLRFRTTAGFAQSAEIKFDNVRYSRYPLIDINDSAFTAHITENEQFYIDVDYNAGSSCTVTETTSGNNYSTTYKGNERYETGPISFEIQSPSAISEEKRFTVNCSGVTNSDPRWRIRINRDETVADGSVEENCVAGTSCVYSVTPNGPGFVAIGDDWNYTRECDSCTGVREFQVIKDQTGSISTDGQYFTKLISGSSTNGTSLANLTNLQLLNGGTVYMDVNYITLSGTGSGNTLQLIYDFVAGGSQTLLDLGNGSSTTPYVGKDINFAIPNGAGYLRFRTGSTFGHNTEIGFDNVRYFSPSFSNNTSCKQIMYNGDPTAKIDLVFVGSGFEDQNEFESTIRFVINENGDENGLFSFEPFKSYKNKFNVWMVDEYKEYQMTNNGISWRFGSDVVNDAAIACPFKDEISLIAIKPRFVSYVIPDFYKNQLTANPTHVSYTFLGCEVLGQCPFPTDVNASNPYDLIDCNGFGNCSFGAETSYDAQRVYSHEFGHSFGGLWDEYHGAGISPLSTSGNLANCSHENTCSKWSGVSEAGCFTPCKFDNWYRPYDQNTLMGSHMGSRKEYREVNETRLKYYIDNYPGCDFCGDVSAFYSFVIDLLWNHGQLSTSSVNFVNGVASSENLIDANYSVIVLDMNGVNQYDFNFTIPTIILNEALSKYDANGNVVVIDNNNSLLTQDSTHYVLTVPFLPAMDKINIYDSNKNLLIGLDTFQYLSKIKYTLGFGGNESGSANYTVRYVVDNQPSKVLYSSNYICQLGGGAYIDS